MPYINIEEQNLTTGAATIGTDIPYIPGFVGYKTADSVASPSLVPVLYTTLAAFEAGVGYKPYKFSTEQTYNDATILREGEYDPSYIMAAELLKQGMPVYYHAFAVQLTGNDAMNSFYTDLSTFLKKDELKDRGEYTIKYVTSGGYPNVFGNDFDLAITMHNLAEDRGDCVAFIEDAWTETPELIGTPGTGEIGSLKYRLENLEGFSGMEFGTTFFGWGNHNLANKFDTKYLTARLPGCYSYLINLAKSIKTNPNWLAIAGVGRGHVSTLNSPAFNTRLSNKIADEYQPRIADPDTIVYAINAITKINPYGYTIWGNRTLKAITQDGLDATHFLNTRNMISDIKKLCYSAAKALMFEQNSELLWLDFKGRLTPYLDRLKISSGISGYSIIKGDSTAREELVCILKIYPISAVEAFDIRIVITDADVDVQ